MQWVKVGLTGVKQLDRAASRSVGLGGAQVKEGRGRGGHSGCGYGPVGNLVTAMGSPVGQPLQTKERSDRLQPMEMAKWGKAALFVRSRFLGTLPQCATSRRQSQGAFARTSAGIAQ